MPLSIEALISIITLAVTGPSALLVTWQLIHSRVPREQQNSGELTGASQLRNQPHHALRSARRSRSWMRFRGKVTVDARGERMMDIEAGIEEIEMGECAIVLVESML
ncbi:hypothetical protein ACMFMF_000240 [Clarireedia jacksonii]